MKVVLTALSLQELNKIDGHFKKSALLCKRIPKTNYYKYKRDSVKTNLKYKRESGKIVRTKFNHQCDSGKTVKTNFNHTRDSGCKNSENLKNKCVSGSKNSKSVKRQCPFEYLYKKASFQYFIKATHTGFEHRRGRRDTKFYYNHCLLVQFAGKIEYPSVPKANIKVLPFRGLYQFEDLIKFASTVTYIVDTDKVPKLALNKFLREKPIPKVPNIEPVLSTHKIPTDLEDFAIPYLIENYYVVPYYFMLLSRKFRRERREIKEEKELEDIRDIYWYVYNETNFREF